jgi:hypothetical protein
MPESVSDNPLERVLATEWKQWRCQKGKISFKYKINLENKLIFPSFLFGLKDGSDWSGCQGTFQVKKNSTVRGAEHGKLL